MRSPTAADIAASWAGVEADFAGLSRDADERISVEHIAWADVIAVMEKRQRSKLAGQFGNLLAHKKVAVLGVPDNYGYMEPALVEVLEPKQRHLLRL
ncbi:phosphotyrosine protein phosphatase [Leisingera sp. ANG59]|uniref:phosphotyrosine protein phosphatase n=1 Tax=Leisingera sp. ANG59 TaxID=2675221 RepID=UPI001A078897|nr:phosphotyrosine protein phosphatase [Leisingera sp. ANG59]NSY37948.1 phosphotyrosine protein phosphatase [Leisingera sp. ANG59]